MQTFIPIFRNAEFQVKEINYSCCSHSNICLILTLLYAEFDILITNPPYSGEHKPRLLEFLKSSGKPFAILLPVYTATKSYWKNFISPEASSGNVSSSTKSPIANNKSSGMSSSNKTLPNREVCYLLPPNEYMYYHPEGTGKDTPPFYSAWFLGNMPFSITRYVVYIINVTKFDPQSKFLNVMQNKAAY